MNLWVAKGCSNPQRDMGCGSTQGMCGILREVHPSKVPHEPNTSSLCSHKAKPPSSWHDWLNLDFKGLFWFHKNNWVYFVFYGLLSVLHRWIFVLFSEYKGKMFVTLVCISAGMRLYGLYFTLIEPLHHAILHNHWTR